MNTRFLFKAITLLFAVCFWSQLAQAGLVFNPQGFNFGAVDAGQTSCHDITLTNNSHSETITLTGWSLYSQSSELTVTPTFNQNVQLGPGQSLTFQICYTPNGSIEGWQNALLVNYTSDHDTSAHSTHVGFTGSLHHNDHDTTDIDPHDSTDHDPHDSTDHNPHDSTDHDPHDSTNHHHCLGTHAGGNSVDHVVIGGTAEHTLYLINPTNFAITVTAATINGADANAFSVTATLPITVPPNSTNTPLTYNFSPPVARNGAYLAEIVLVLSGDSLGCQTVTGQLIGYPAVHHDDHGNHSDSTIRPLFPEENRTLAIQGNGDHTSVTFYFTNNLNVDVTVNSISLEDGTYFTISSTTPNTTPFVLQPGATMSVEVTYTATDNHVHQDHLVINASHQIQAISFDLQGAHSAQASVSGDLPEGVIISISPNPSKDVVKLRLEGVRSSAIELVDLLGRTLATGSADQSWSLDAKSLTPGTYIVKIKGESVRGEKFILSKIIVVE